MMMGKIKRTIDCYNAVNREFSTLLDDIKTVSNEELEPLSIINYPVSRSDIIHDVVTGSYIVRCTSQKEGSCTMKPIVMSIVQEIVNSDSDSHKMDLIRYEKRVGLYASVDSKIKQFSSYIDGLKSIREDLSQYI